MAHFFKDAWPIVLGLGGVVAFVVVAGWIAQGSGEIALLLVVLAIVGLSSYAAMKHRSGSPPSVPSEPYGPDRA